MQRAGLGSCHIIDEYLNGHDLYPNVQPCLHALQDIGYFVGIAGQPDHRAGRFLRVLNLPCDILATSDGWCVTNLTWRFSSNSSRSAATNHEIAYVGDRLDNDLHPAVQAVCVPSLSGCTVGLHHYERGSADLGLGLLSGLPAVLKTLSTG